MNESTISSRGQVVIPRVLRKRAGLRKGLKIQWSMWGRDTIVGRKTTGVSQPMNWNEWARATAGLGKELWKGIDPVEYTREMRRDRPQPR